MQDPGIVKAVQSFRQSDWAFVAQATAATTVIGYFIGRSTYLHRPTAVMGGIIGASFGVAFGLQNSAGRLMGLVKNDVELEATKAD